MADENTENSETPQCDLSLQRQGVPVPHRTPSDVMRRSLISVLAHWRELDAAIENHDFEAVEGIAGSAVGLWLMARAACQQLIANSAHPTPLTFTALEAIDDIYRKLVDQFERATKVIAVPRMANALAVLRGTMDTAKAEPPYRNNDIKGAR